MSERVPAGGPYRSSIGLHESLSVEHLREARRMLSTYCYSPGEVCSAYLDILGRVSSLIARARLEDLGGLEGYAGVDQDIVGIERRVREFYSKYISGALVTHGEHVLARALANFEHGGVMYLRGDLARLEPGSAAKLYVSGLIEPLESVALLPWPFHG